MLNGRKKQSKRLKKKQGRKEKELNLGQRWNNQLKKLERGRDELKNPEQKAVEKKQATGFQSGLTSPGGISCSTVNL